MTYTLDISLSLGTGKAGLTDLRAQLVDTTGAAVGSAIATGFTEIGSGCYLWHCTAIPDGHRGGVKFYSAATPGTILAFGAINPEGAENLAQIKAKTDLLNATFVGGLLTTPNQTVPLVAELGPAQTGLAIGYRVLRLDGTVFSAFTTAGVVETATPGTYRAVDGIEAPGEGGTVIVGTAGADLREAAIESMLPMYGLGGGGIAFEYTLTNGLDGTPIADATVEVYSDAGMSTLVAIGETNALGVVMFYLDAGTYYLKRLKFGYDFVNPDVETVA